MLGVDSLTQQRWQAEQKREKALEARQRELAEFIRSNTVTVEDDAGKNVSDLLSRLGKPLTAEKVIEKLKKCNSRLYFERSRAYPNMYGVYLRNPEGRVHVTPDGDVVIITHLFGMEAGIMPEFSVLHRTNMKVPNSELIGNRTPTRDVDWKEIETFADETRGWRTVLVRLLHAGLITSADVDRHFGWNPSVESRKWKEQTT